MRKRILILTCMIISAKLTLEYYLYLRVKIIIYILLLLSTLEYLEVRFYE